MRALLLLLSLVGVLVGCREDPTGPGGPPGQVPGDLDGRYEWIFRGWDGTQPVGQASVQLRWTLPTNWGGEPFRVYGRRSTAGNYLLLATVTSCATGLCRYTDVNVSPGQSYDYFVALVDERSGTEVPSPSAVRITIPQMTRPIAPLPDTAVALNDALYLRWRQGGTAPDTTIWKYQVYLVELTDQTQQSVLYQVGETDATGFLDLRAVNGVEYVYRIAAVNLDGHISDMSAPIRGVPRPDYTAELIYAHADRSERSGFRFVRSAELDPILPGASADAHWRLEIEGNEWRVRPLNGAQIHPTSVFTTALTCGPASGAGCISVNLAPEAGYTANPVAVLPEYTYVLRIPGSEGPGYAKFRVSLLGSDQEGRLMIFDWAYQFRPGVRSLSVQPE